MKKSFVLTILSISVILSSSCKKETAVAAEDNSNTELVCTEKLPFAVVELFTSQGCSSCPPAEEMINEMVKDETENVLYIENHVDYWNGPLPGPCGVSPWVDPYSSKFYTDRQRSLIQTFGTLGLITPWFQISTQYATYTGNGANNKKIPLSKAAVLAKKDEVLLQPASAGIVLRLKSIDEANKKLKVEFATLDADLNHSIEFVLLESEISTKITSGENCNLTLESSNIARSWHSESATKHGVVEITIPDNAKLEHCEVAAFIKNPTDHTVAGATKGFKVK